MSVPCNANAVREFGSATLSKRKFSHLPEIDVKHIPLAALEYYKYQFNLTDSVNFTTRPMPLQLNASDLRGKKGDR